MVAENISMREKKHFLKQNTFFSMIKFEKSVLLLSLVLLMYACATKKNVDSKKSTTSTVSMSDYPYIEKFHEGLRLKSKGEIDNAIRAFNYCLTVKQTDAAVYYALSGLYLEKKDLVKSSESIRMAAKLDPSNIWYVQEMAYMFFEQGNFEESVKAFEKLVKNQPNNVDWLYGYAECLLRTGKINEAIKALDKTEEQVGKHPELAVQKFNLYLRIKETQKALNEIENARKEFPHDPQLIGTLVDYYFQTKQESKAILMLEELTISDPTNGRAHLGLADIYRQQGKKKEYYSELKKGFTCEDVDIDTKMKILINIHEQPGKLPTDAHELVDIMISHYPKDSKAYSIKGDFLLKADKEDEALEAYKNALKYDKSKFTIWNQVLIMEYQAAKYADLYVESKECLELFPSIPSVYLLNGIAANQEKKYAEASEVLLVGKDLIVNNKVLEAEVYSQLGEAYFGLKKNTEAKASYESALQLDPNSTLIMNNFAYHLALAKVDLDEAEELIIKANTLSPNQSHFIDTHGWIMFQRGNYSKAKEYFEKAYSINSSDKIIVEHLGDVSIKTGDITKAIEYWTRAKQLGSTNKNLDKKIEKKEYYEPVY